MVGALDNYKIIPQVRTFQMSAHTVFAERKPDSCIVSGLEELPCYKQGVSLEI